MAESKGAGSRPNAGQLQRGLERRELVVWKGDQKGLEEDHCFTQAGIEVELALIEAFPKAVRANKQAADEIVNRFAKFVPQSGHHLVDGRYFVDKLRAPGKEHLVQESGDAGRALAAGASEVFRR